MKKLYILISICILVFSLSFIVHADELEDISRELEKTRQELDSSRKATETNEGQLKAINQRLENIKARVTGLEREIKRKETEISEGEDLIEEQKVLLDERIVSYYKNSGKVTDSFMNLMLAENLSTSFNQFFYQKSLMDEDRRTIMRVVMKVQSIEEKKNALKVEQQKLIPIKEEIDKNSQFLAQEVEKSKKFENELTDKIVALSAKQQAILSAKSGSFTASIGTSELADEFNSSIKGFREGAPSGSFGIFSFGAYTHRKGMSQYGARGRAQAGQDYKTILKAYYGKEPTDKDTSGNIKVSGHGEMDFETVYLWGIAEMPSSWHAEALKAQAVAARSYAYRYKAEGKEICATESCQVFNKGKSENPPDAWKQAIEATKGQVLEDVVTYFSSTAGGFGSPIGWDTTDGSGGGDFIDKTWEKAGGSPWLYKAWYRKGYSVSGETCGRSTPWFSNEEMADIVNAAIVPQDERIVPVTTECWGGNPYSMQELRDKGGVTSVSSVRVSQGNGSTSEVVFQTNKGEIKISAATFKEKFNLRAPGYVRIPQTGFSFFNIEQK